MPYKAKKDRRKYDKEYWKHKQRKLKAVEKAVRNGDLARAKNILERKPNIRIKKKGRRG